MLWDDLVLGLLCVVAMWVIMHGVAAMWLVALLFAFVVMWVFCRYERLRGKFWRANLLSVAGVLLLNLPYEMFVEHNHWSVYPLSCWQMLVLAWIALLFVQGIAWFFAFVARG